MTDADRLGSFGWDERAQTLFDDVGVDGAVPARVVRVERTACVLVGADGVERTSSATTGPAVGDWVAVVAGAVVAVLPRWSALTRGDPDGAGIQVLAANIDLVFISVPADRPSASRVERELMLAWESGAQPVVVMTKADLAAPDTVEKLRERLVGVEVFATSATTGAGLDILRTTLQPCRTAVLMGPSGAGKSTLANQLLGTDSLATGEVRSGDRRGRHTTTSRQLVRVPGGGVLIDTPGLRSLGLVDGGGEMERVFPDIDEWSRACRFRDCRHSAEPDCAVLAAAHDGALPPARLASYLKLREELAGQQGRGRGRRGSP
ncbi:MAG: ribosome small subunit-dependent GTPase A [Acidimicrobiales bacterium]